MVLERCEKAVSHVSYVFKHANATLRMIYRNNNDFLLQFLYEPVGHIKDLLQFAKLFRIEILFVPTLLVYRHKANPRIEACHI